MKAVVLCAVLLAFVAVAAAQFYGAYSPFASTYGHHVVSPSVYTPSIYTPSGVYTPGAYKNYYTAGAYRPYGGAYSPYYGGFYGGVKYV